METVSVSRTIDASREEISAAMHDIEPFMRAAGFDNVTVDGDEFTIENSVGLLTISLDLRLVDRGAELAYEQVDGIFKSMETRYVLEDAVDATTVLATTDFALDANVVGPILDSTIISRQRRKELDDQFDYLESAVGGSD